MLDNLPSLDDKGTMFLAEMSGTGPGCRRLVATLLLLVFFFLPLHIHLATASQASKECSCAEGNRTQLGLAPAALDWIPSLLTLSIAIYEPELSGPLSVTSHTIRAPPSTHAL